MGLFKSKNKLKLKQEIENIGDGKFEADLIKKENKRPTHYIARQS